MHKQSRAALSAAMAPNGLVTTRGAAAAGVGGRTLSRAVAAGELDRHRQRVYGPAGIVLTWEDELAADLAACHAEAFAARTAALQLHGIVLPTLEVERELVVLGTARPTVRSGVVVHRTLSLPDEDRTAVRGIPSTTAERGLIDVAGRLTVVRRLLAVDGAIMSERADRTVLHERAVALSRGRRGVRTLAAATAPDAEARFRSQLEKRGAPLLARAGLAAPLVNVVPHDAPMAGETDVVSEADRIIIDWDGLRFHAGPTARQRDNEKSNAAVIGGYTALRFTWYDVVVRPGYVIATTRRAIAANRR